MFTVPTCVQSVGMDLLFQRAVFTIVCALFNLQLCTGIVYYLEHHFTGQCCTGVCSVYIPALNSLVIVNLASLLFFIPFTSTVTDAVNDVG